MDITIIVLVYFFLMVLEFGGIIYLAETDRISITTRNILLFLMLLTPIIFVAVISEGDYSMI